MLTGTCSRTLFGWQRPTMEDTDYCPVKPSELRHHQFISIACTVIDNSSRPISEKVLGYCKEIIVTNYVITLAKVSCQ